MKFKNLKIKILKLIDSLFKEHSMENPKGYYGWNYS